MHRKLTKMKKLLLYIFCICISPITIGQTIATCSNPDGYANYHYAGIWSRKESGFIKDKITGGMTTFQKLPDGTFDILFVDTRKKIISATQDGGKVVFVRKGKKDATFIHIFPGKVIEIYTLWIDNDGVKKYDLLQSKGGDEMPVHKSSVLVGKCDEINLTLLD